MAIFAPPYNPSKQQQPLLVRRQQAESKKRKRGSSDDDVPTPEAHSPGPEPTPRTAASAFHPVNRTDPYYIAGHPREHPLPPAPFPHAAVKDSGGTIVPIEEELGKLNPPLYVPAQQAEDNSTSLRRRHLDNVTTILHRCMLKGDWKRAHRAWGLLVRTEIQGRGVDVRRHGRWGIGAELLMRQGGREDHADGAQQGADENVFTDAGFDMAREYYERLILQYPHTQHSQHHLNATAIYPALFNIWIYSVQDRSQRARKQLDAERPSSSDSNASTGSQHHFKMKQVRTQELDDAATIAARLDDLLLSPPYDTDTTLLQLRGMVALWLSDLCTKVAELESKDVSTSEMSEDNTEPSYMRGARSAVERRKARDLFRKLDARGVDVPESTMIWLGEND